MTDHRNAEELARLWIDAWDRGDPSVIPLAEAFTHTSPFGVIEGRSRYLEWMEPVTGRGPSLNIVRTLDGGDQAAIWYEMSTGDHALACCDWIEAEDGEIVAITSFYDATALR